MKIMVTPRVRLRPWRITDAKDMFEYASRKFVGPKAGWKPHETIEESEMIIAAFIASNEVWAIEHLEDKKVIGSIGLHKDEKRPKMKSRMIGYVLHEDYWGKGYMVEAVEAMFDFAFNELGLDLVAAVHYPDNPQSKRVMEKCGMTYEGTLRHAGTVYNGTVRDHCCYSILKEEFDARVSTI